MTLNRMVASFDYACLIWGMEEAGHRGGEGGECRRGGLWGQGRKALRMEQGFGDAHSTTSSRC